MKRKQTQSSDSSKAAKRVLRSNTTLEIDIAEKEREMTIAVEFVNDGCSIRDAAERVGVPFKTVHRCFFNCKIFCNILYFRAKKRVDAGGSCLGVNGRPSVLSKKSLDDLKRTATLRDLGHNSFTEVQLMDALTK